MAFFVELLRIIYDKDREIGARILDRCGDLARSPSHERDRDGADADPHIEAEGGLVARRTRREILEVLIGAGVTATVTTTAAALVSSVVAGIEALDNAANGKSFDIDTEFVNAIEEARRTAFSRPVAGNNTNQAQLLSVVQRLNSGRVLSSGDKAFLAEVAQSRCEADVCGYAAQLLSTEHGRCGEMEQARKILRTDIACSSQSLGFSILVQKANLDFMTTPRYLAMEPNRWAVAASLNQLKTNFGSVIDCAANDIPSLKNDAKISFSLHEFGAPFVHACFFFWYRFTASKFISQQERREIWSEQLEFYRRCCKPSVVGSTNVERAIWNHFLLLAIQADRFEDWDYRNKFIQMALGEDESGPMQKAKTDMALAERFTKLDHMYVMFSILLASIEAREDKIRAPELERQRFEYLVARRAELPNQSIRVALDTFRKLRHGYVSDEDAVRDYVARTSNFDCFIPDIVRPATQGRE